VEPNLINWPQLIAMMTYKPAAIIGIDKGTLAPGKQGDVTIIDPEYKWKIDSAKFYSKSRNCPYQNWEVKAKPIYTIVGGEIRYALEA
jgi:dihydroorotase